MIRDGSQNRYFNRRIPADVKRLAVGLRLSLPVGEEFTSVTVSSGMEAIRVSLRTSDPREVKTRQAKLDDHLEEVWARLRQEKPTVLTHKQAIALGGELYRVWADGEARERTRGMVRIPVGDIPEGKAAKEWQWVPDDDPMDGEPGIWAALQEHLSRVAKLDAAYSPKSDPKGVKRPLEVAFGAVVDELLSRQALLRIDPTSRELLLKAFHGAMVDASAHRERNAAEDYSPDPKAARFPALQDAFAKDDAKPGRPAAAKPKVSLKALFENWWSEAKTSGRTTSTYDSYARTFRLFGESLGHDDANRISQEDVKRFKEERLAARVAMKTFRDSDLAALKSVFNWALDNGLLKENPAANIRLMIPKTTKVRERAFEDSEVKAILNHALNHRAAKRETAKVAAAKRWVPWICAYTGARVGEIAQLRKSDVERGKEFSVITISPEAGTVKNKEVRKVVLHEHLVATGFLDFVDGLKPGYLFLNAAADAGPDEIRGLWRSVKNRLTDFVREVLTDLGVAPNHGWRHTFKMIGGRADMREKVLDAICGHAHTNEGRKYGPVQPIDQAQELKKFPRYKL